ncbi:MAG: hypothetical protein VX519_01565 [Myxococcota bacterium]|nr:hypothetical protein [Myxococcota bacterium]
MPRHSATLLLTSFLLLGCDRDAMYEQKSLTSSIQEVWKDCDESEISFLTAKNGIQTAFENCGANPFTYFTWSPDGIHIYFQLAFEGYVMNAEEKTIRELPKEQRAIDPIHPQSEGLGLFQSCQGAAEPPAEAPAEKSLLPLSNATWLDNGRLILPVGPGTGESGPRLALANLTTNEVEYMALEELREPQDLHATGSEDSILFTALDSSDQRGLYKASFSSKTVEKAFAWHQTPVETFSYTAEPDLVTWGHENTVTVAKGATGEVVHTFENATRGTVHPDGLLIALETQGDPISTFKPKSGGDDSPQAQRRQDAREQKWQEDKPDWVPSELVPPALEIFDAQVDKRYRLTEIHGLDFQWYPGHAEYGSFVMWGLEQTQLNKNVALTALGARILRLRDKDELPKGIKLVPPSTAPKTSP